MDKKFIIGSIIVPITVFILSTIVQILIVIFKKNQNVKKIYIVKTSIFVLYLSNLIISSILAGFISLSFILGFILSEKEPQRVSINIADERIIPQVPCDEFIVKFEISDKINNEPIKNNIFINKQNAKYENGYIIYKLRGNYGAGIIFKIEREGYNTENLSRILPIPDPIKIELKPKG